MARREGEADKDATGLEVVRGWTVTNLTTKDKRHASATEVRHGEQCRSQVAGWRQARGGSSEDFDVSCVVRWPAD